MTIDTKECSVKAIYDDIVKSEGDNRIYRGLVLKNDMKVLLASDPYTEKAAASMDVHIGEMKYVVVMLGLHCINSL